MSVEFRTRRRVEWADTDRAGIVHFARFFVFMEAAEHAFWRSLGLSVHSECDGNIISWPRLIAECEYFRPVSFEDVLDIHVHLEKQGEKSLSFRFEFHCDGEQIAQGRLKIACCVCNPGEAIRAIPIPDFITTRLASTVSSAEPSSPKSRKLAAHDSTELAEVP